jgi:hypothetical protein
MLLVALVLVTVVGVVAAVVGRIPTALLLAGAVNFAAAIGRLAFEAIVQRDAPDANRGRALANYYTKFQLMWVLAGIIPVLLKLPGVVGFAVVSAIGFSGGLVYWLSNRQVSKGLEPSSVVAQLRQRFSRR